MRPHKDKNIKTYTSPSQFGLASYTSIAQICEAMPDNSKFISSLHSSATSDFKFFPYGVLEITKITEFRCKIQVDNANATDTIIYVNKWRSDTGLGSWLKISNVNITTGTEIETGRVVDGKIEYYKRISLSTLPNNSTQEVSTGISNAKLTRMPTGVICRSDGAQFPLPVALKSGHEATLLTISNVATLQIFTNDDYFSAMAATVDLYYTKNG